MYETPTYALHQNREGSATSEENGALSPRVARAFPVDLAQRFFHRVDIFSNRVSAMSARPAVDHVVFHLR